MKIFYRRYIAVICLLGATLSALFYLRLDGLQRAAVNNQFRQEIDRKVDLLEREIQSHLATVRFTKNLFETFRIISADEFERVNRSTLDDNPELVAIEWIPLVTAADRLPLERQRQQQIAGFHFKEFSEHGGLILAQQRSEYFPVYYSQRDGQGEVMLGLDLAAEEGQRRMLMNSRLTGQLAVVLGSANNKREKTGVELRVFEPVYRGEPNSDTERFRSLKGFVLVRFMLADIVMQVFKETDLRQIRVQLINSNSVGTEVLFDASPQKEQVLFAKFRYQKPLRDIGGQRWLIDATPTNAYLTAHKSAMAEMVFGFGMILTLVVTFFLLIISKREEKIQEIVSQRTKELSAANQKLELMTLTDALTGVVNRRGFDQVLEIEWNRSIREDIPITLLLIDVDCFKYYNDNYGHIAGDDCLKRVAEAIAGVPQRLGDLVARYGGEEFAVMLPNTDDKDSVVAHKCRLGVEALAIEHGYSPVARVVTVSIGTATVRPQRGTSFVSLIQAADEAMYLAKTEGRNRVVKAPVEGV